MFNLNCLRNLNKTNNIKIINLVIVLLLLSMLLPAQVIAAQPITVTVNGACLDNGCFASCSRRQNAGAHASDF